jgi:hypothetical protein
MTGGAAQPVARDTSVVGCSDYDKVIRYDTVDENRSGRF